SPPLPMLAARSSSIWLDMSSFPVLMSGAWRAAAWLLASDASIGAGRRLSKWKKRAGTMSFTHAGTCAHESASAPALCVARVRGRGTLRLLHPGGEQPVHHPERDQPPCTDAGRKPGLPAVRAAWFAAGADRCRQPAG